MDNLNMPITLLEHREKSGKKRYNCEIMFHPKAEIECQDLGCYKSSVETGWRDVLDIDRGTMKLTKYFNNP